MTSIKFGTDGWRAKIADTFTYENLGRVADAFAAYALKDTKKPVIAFGYDNRFMSERYAQFVADRISGYGIDVKMFDKSVHTPMVSWTVVKYKLDFGLMITSSHNPASYNGFKIKNKFGAGLSTEETRKVESYMDVPVKEAVKHGKIEIVNFDREYISAISAVIDIKAIKKSGMKIVMDCMYGSGSGYMEAALAGYKNLTVINNYRDPLFGGINPEPIKQNLGKLMETVKKEKADIGIAIDGDGDRMALVNGKGEFITSHKVLVFMILHHIRHRKMKFRFVKTISGTFLVNRIAQENNIELIETPVGFKYIGEKIIDDPNTIGGEESGGVGFGYYLPERDGIFGNLIVLEFLAKEGKTIDRVLTELDKKYGAYKYDRVDISFKEKDRDKIYKAVDKLEKAGMIAGKKISSVSRLDGTKYILAGNEWLLFRFSGTEPLLRIYSEAPTDKRVKENLEFGKSILG
jgi:phosphomannomutase